VSAPTDDARAHAGAGPGEDDPYLWLEEVTGDRALAWVRERNAETVADLVSGGRFASIRDGIREVLDSTDKLPGLHWRGEYLYNVWQDEAHPRGLWRRTTVDGVRADAWEVLLDLDALAAAENENWVWAGAEALRPDNQRYLLHLSRGGADAAVVREFDLSDGFVSGGFHVPEAKTTACWIDIDHVFLGTDFGRGSLTTSGYARIAKRWTRGTPLSQAVTVFEGSPEDVRVVAVHDATPGFERDLVIRRTTFWDAQTYLLGTADELSLLELPSDATVDVHREWVLVRLRTPWTAAGVAHRAGTLLAVRLAELLTGDWKPTVLFEPAPDTTLQYWDWTRSHLVLGLLHNVHSELIVLDPPHEESDQWARSPLPGVSEVDQTQVMDTNPDHTDELLITTTGFTTPSALLHTTVRTRPEVLRQEPSFFDVPGHSVHQHWATSADGTAVPYFHVTGANLDGPTLLEAYGGFEICRTPTYDAALGRGWLARGGNYVLANIRGGGEFGPDWHFAALREKRPRAFEDLAAVAQDLHGHGVTTPRRLGVTGGSNGGLLMGVMLTRYPSLFGAIVATVPLLDMRRYHVLLAGASWMAEYGDPDSDDWQFIAPYSPYHNVAATPTYPPVLWITSTRDDRVHPGHARKMTARLREFGHQVAYYENIEGGHSAAADNAQRAFRRALAFEFLWRHLS
jgi:prolyl oligopeptidase